MPYPRRPVELDAVFGDPLDPIETVARRAEQAFPQQDVVVWEGDATTFQFGFVSQGAQKLLGYSVSRWTEEATFWADIVVHPEDRDDAVAYCALATGKRRDHVFDYRARTEDGRIVWLRDWVAIVTGSRGIPVRLRGVMFDISEAKREAGEFDSAGGWIRSPTREELLGL